MIKRAWLVSAMCISALQSPILSAAQLEEVIVTAQLREQSLQDVPVSVSAISGSKMMEAGLSKIEDLQAYVPNFTMTESSIGTDIYIRGIGSGENQGFEQSVGMYVDGIYYGRAQLARAPFLDLERVEVLRGPQNILLGKNSIAGAINISSASPSNEAEFFVQGTYEPDLNEQVIDFMASGPFTDNFSARFAMRQRKTDGFVENQILDRDEAARKEATYRLKFAWDAGNDFDAKLKLEMGSFDVIGRQSEILTDNPSDSDIFLFTGRTYGEILNDTVFPDLGAIGGLLGALPVGIRNLLQLQDNGSILNLQADDSVLDHTADRKRSSNGDFSNNDTQNITVNMNWYSNGNTFTSITGYMAYQ
ncbi:TonB-dependent receptor, partial [Zhongshania sp.]|uniref:TonB-dependent receptor n=1 Tax=Zhongshania sp. TaxID=1971902 RepID=UPI0039E463D2